MDRNKAQTSRAAIERLYITMRHLFMRGSYKPMGISGASLRDALIDLSPEIYGLIASKEKVELDGLLYVMDRLPRGIEECRYIRLISREGYENGGFEVLFPPKRRRKCYRIDRHQMYVEMTRGRSDIYDILTHLSFLFIESEKIRLNSTDPKGAVTHDWLQLERIVSDESDGKPVALDSACSYLSHIVGRTFLETREAVLKFERAYGNSLFHIVYYLGHLAMQEHLHHEDREIFFSATLRERIGQHVYGDKWANRIKNELLNQGLIERPLHIISANLHSVVNAVYGHQMHRFESFEALEQFAISASQNPNAPDQLQLWEFAKSHGLIELDDHSGTNIGVQIIDTAQLPGTEVTFNVKNFVSQNTNAPVLIVMDYAFGEQAFECMDELLKPLSASDTTYFLNVQSIAIMGKAGILKGHKGDLMIPSAHFFEGTADNYPFENGLEKSDFEGFGLGVFDGPMVTVLGTSLQNKDILRYFMTSSWKACGLEMEGAHYQKAIQAASKIRGSIRKDVQVFFAYYASDNPLETGSTLASGGLGTEGVKPTYLVTKKILEKIFSNA
jgi:hypothetical protein